MRTCTLFFGVWRSVPDCCITQVPYAVVDSYGAATTAAARVTLPPAAHWPCSWPPSTLLFFCIIPTQPYGVLSQWQAHGSVLCVHLYVVGGIGVPHTPFLSEAWLDVYICVSATIADSAARRARDDGLPDADTAPRQLVLAGLFGHLFRSTSPSVASDLLLLLLFWCELELNSIHAGVGCR